MSYIILAPWVLILERWLGYPPSLLRLIGHPVIWFGAFISALENRLNISTRTPQQLRLAGVVATAILLLVVLANALIIQQILRFVPFGWLLEAIVATSFLAQKELGRAVRAVAEALGKSLPAGREAVSHIVGRDPQALDEAGVCRAAIETLAESTSDGVVAPWFWLVLLGLPGIALYKAINTADSMIGHLNDRYRHYGWAAAKLDDWVNWIPARLTLVLITAACFLVPKASPSHAWNIAKRDAGKHASPNSGWPEAAFAGALDFALGGPRSYDGVTLDLPVFGNGRAALSPRDVLQALLLYRVTLNVLLSLSFFMAVIALAMPS